MSRDAAERRGIVVVNLCHQAPAAARIGLHRFGWRRQRSRDQWDGERQTVITVRLKADTTGITVRLKPDATTITVRLKVDATAITRGLTAEPIALATCGGSVRLQPDRDPIEQDIERRAADICSEESEQDEPEIAVHRSRARRVFEGTRADVVLELASGGRRLIDQACRQAGGVLEQITDGHLLAIG